MCGNAVSDPERFKVIHGGDKPKPYRARNKRDPEPLVCPCGSSTTIETKAGRMIDDNRIKGGTKQIRCYHCGKVLV